MLLSSFLCVSGAEGGLEAQMAAWSSIFVSHGSQKNFFPAASAWDLTAELGSFSAPASCLVIKVL